MLTIKLDGLDAALALFTPKVVNKAASLAINEAAKAGRTAAGKAIMTRWNVKAAKLNKELENVKMSTTSDLTAIISAKGRPISLTYYGARQIRRPAGRGTGRKVTKGVTVEIRKGEQKSIPKAFMVTLPNGHKAVAMNVATFTRTDYAYHTPSKGRYAGQRGRTKIVNMATISIGTMFGKGAPEAAAALAIEDTWDARFEHHLDRLTK